MSDRARLALYSGAHFWVDLSCALLLLRRLDGLPSLALGLLLYNFCAFALQMPLGLLADRSGRCGLTAAGGCALTALAYLLPGPLPAAVTAGVGNALFHLGGGIDVLRRSRERAAALGVFVSPGALGLYLGRLLAGTNLPLWPEALVLLGLAAALAPLRRTPVCEAVSGETWRILPLFLVVVLRSYMGMNQSFSWRNAGAWALALTLALVLGKTAGGFVMDRLGARRASGWTLAAAAVLYLCSGWPLPGTAAVFLFNMTMPVTLWAAARILPLGFSFGLLTFGLFLGFLPSCLGWPNLLTGPGAYAAVTLVSLGLLYAGLGRDNPC